MLVEVARVGDVAAGGVIVVQAGRGKLVLCNCDGKYYAVSRRCGHMNSPLDYGALDGTILTCPMHHVQFDVTTGEALNPPIPGHLAEAPPQSWLNWLSHLAILMQHIDVCDVRTYRVEVEGDSIRVDLGPSAGPDPVA